MTPDRLTLEELSDRAVVAAEQAASVLGIGRSSAFQAVHRGQHTHIQIGRRILIPTPHLLRLLQGETSQQD
jgi:hypothetical protein